MKLIEPIQEFTSLLLEVSFMPPNEGSNEKKLTLSYIENLYNRLFFFPVSERIKEGLIADGWTDEVLKNRLKTARYLLKNWITPDGIAQFETDGLLSNESESMQYVCGKLGAADGRRYMLKVFTLFREVNQDIRMVAETLKEVENLITPQPDTTELPPIFQQYDIFKDNASVAKVFVSLIDEGLIKIDGNLFRWLDDRNSLCYFCYSLNLHYDLNTKNNNVPWVSFKNMFLCKIWDKWVEQTNNDLRDNWQQYLKNAKSEYAPNGEQGKILPPRGKQKIWEKIENSML